MNFREIKHVMTNLTPVKSLCEYISAVNYISHTFTDNLWFSRHAKKNMKISHQSIGLELGSRMITVLRMNMRFSKRLQEKAK